MNTPTLATAALLTAAAAMMSAPAASASEVGYLKALEDAGVLSTDGDPCNMINGLCHGAFTTVTSALSSGNEVRRPWQ